MDGSKESAAGRPAQTAQQRAEFRPSVAEPAEAVKKKSELGRGGFLVVPRSILSAELHSKPGPWSRLEALLDLLARARYGAGTATVRLSGREYNIGPGEQIVSHRILAARWQWSRGAVRRFLAEWASNNLFSAHQAAHQATHLTLCEAARSGNARPTKRPTKRPTNPQNPAHRKKKDLLKEGKREGSPPTPPLANITDPEPDQESDKVPLPDVDLADYPPGHQGDFLFAKDLRALAARTTSGVGGGDFVNQVVEAVEDGATRAEVVQAFQREADRSTRRVYFKVLAELREQIKERDKVPAPKGITPRFVLDQSKRVKWCLSPPDEAEAQRLADRLNASGHTILDVHAATSDLHACPDKRNGTFSASLLKVLSQRVPGQADEDEAEEDRLRAQKTTGGRR